MTQQLLNDDEIVTELDISHLTIEDDTPVDNFQSEKQQRLLVEPLYSSWSPGAAFIAAANVGLFYALKQDPIVPDAFLSLNVQMPADWSKKQNRSYFVWEFGKLPEVCIEIVSKRQLLHGAPAQDRTAFRKGNELDSKKDDYARIGIAYYVVFDPLKQLQGEDELNGALLKAWELTGKKYIELPNSSWLESVGLGLTLWEGTFEDQPGMWLRWCDPEGRVIPTGAERAETERQGREAERQRADRLAERLRDMGVDPSEV